MNISERLNTKRLLNVMISAHGLNTHEKLLQLSARAYRAKDTRRDETTDYFVNKA